MREKQINEPSAAERHRFCGYVRAPSELQTTCARLRRIDQHRREIWRVERRTVSHQGCTRTRTMADTDGRGGILFPVLSNV